MVAAEAAEAGAERLIIVTSEGKDGVVAHFVEDLVLEGTLEARGKHLMLEKVRRAPALIKVDVEGAEGQVFAGAVETLQAHRPVVLFECVREMLESNGSSPEAIFKLFESCNYTVKDAFDDQRPPASGGHCDVIALPN